MDPEFLPGSGIIVPDPAISERAVGLQYEIKNGK